MTLSCTSREARPAGAARGSERYGPPPTGWSPRFAAPASRPLCSRSRAASSSSMGRRPAYARPPRDPRSCSATTAWSRSGGGDRWETSAGFVAGDRTCAIAWVNRPDDPPRAWWTTRHSAAKTGVNLPRGKRPQRGPSGQPRAVICGPMSLPPRTIAPTVRPSPRSSKVLDHRPRPRAPTSDRPSTGCSGAIPMRWTATIRESCGHQVGESSRETVEREGGAAARCQLRPHHWSRARSAAASATGR